MQAEYTALSELDKFASGAISSRLECCMEAVAKNIADTNTKAEAVRTITIKMTIKPNAERDGAKMALSVVPTLAPNEPVETSVMIGMDENRKMVIVEKTKQLPGQYDIFGNELRPKVLSMNGGESK